MDNSITFVSLLTDSDSWLTFSKAALFCVVVAAVLSESYRDPAFNKPLGLAS
jgi:hypothetical protein